MIPIGEQLRAARERKGLSLDRVADETNIAKRYLVALEAEEFEVFPGDPYVIGFIRNYAEYLGLASDDFANAYKNMKIQEQPVPIAELIPKRGPSRALVAAIVVAGLGAVALILFLTLGRKAPEGTELATARHSPVEYRVEGANFEKRLFVGDSLLVAFGNEKYKLLVTRIDDAVSLETPVGASRLTLGEEGTIDLDRNNKPELKILVSDLAKKDPSKGAVLRLEYSSPDEALKAATEAPAPAEAVEAAQPGQAAQAAAVAPGASAAAAPVAQAPAAQGPAPSAQSAPGKPVLLFEAGKKSPYPFVVSVTFRGPCMFRYEVDKRDREEHYYRKGDAVTINAQNSLRLWASNAQAVKLTVQASGGKSADLDLGGSGEVAVKRIAWTVGDSGGWILGASEVD